MLLIQNGGARTILFRNPKNVINQNSLIAKVAFQLRVPMQKRRDCGWKWDVS